MAGKPPTRPPSPLLCTAILITLPAPFSAEIARPSSDLSGTTEDPK